MNQQYPEHAGHVQNSQTSFDAATRVEQRGKQSREQMIYNALRDRPRTVSQLGEDLGLPHEVISPRCGEMRSRGLLGPTGEQRLSKYGNKVDVLRIIAPYSPKSTQAITGRKRRNDIDRDKLKTARAFLTLIKTKDQIHMDTIKKILDEVIAL